MGVSCREMYLYVDPADQQQTPEATRLLEEMKKTFRLDKSELVEFSKNDFPLPLPYLVTSWGLFRNLDQIKWMAAHHQAFRI